MVFTSKFTGYIKIKEIVNWLQLENVIQRIGEGSWRWCSILAANLLPAKHTQTPPTPNINSPFHAKKELISSTQLISSMHGLHQLRKLCTFVK
jgi:hypothetical protein